MRSLSCWWKIKKCLKEEVSTITMSERIVGNSEIDVRSKANVKSPKPKSLVPENEAVDFF